MSRTLNSPLNLKVFIHVKLAILSSIFEIVDVLIKLRDSNDPKFKVDFHVDFS